MSSRPFDSFMMAVALAVLLAGCAAASPRTLKKPAPPPPISAPPRVAEPPADLDAAIWAVDVAAVERFLAGHSPVNPPEGTTSPLSEALRLPGNVGKERWAIFNLLLAAGADPHRDADGFAPAVVLATTACLSEDDDVPLSLSCLPIVQTLVRKGVRVAATSLSVALTIPDPRRAAVLDALLAGKLDQEAATYTLFGWAEGARDASVVSKFTGSPGFTWTLGIADGEDSPLIHAAWQHDVSLLRALLEAGGPANLQVDDRRTPLSEAIRPIEAPEDLEREVATVKLLLSFHANPNVIGSATHRTPLMHAVDYGHVGTVAALLDGGASINTRTRYMNNRGELTGSNETALDVAEEKHESAIADLLRKRGGKSAKAPRK